MIRTANLGESIRKQLPAELVSFMLLAGKTAAGFNQKLYLVGGVVRDLLLERPNLDLDLVAEGNAIKLAEELARLKNGQVIAHSRFNTAKIRWDRWSVDIATARSEGYARPGALPEVKPSDIRSDLIRRDFTINAMAVYLEPLHFGELIDLYGGRNDLEQKVIRILHENSFQDDATRLWRAVRFEQRLDFQIESSTLEMFRRDLDYLGSISGDRIRHELELCLEEERPERALFRAGELGLLAKISPALKAGQWLVKKIARARGMLQPYTPPENINLAFLVYHLNPQELAGLTAYLKLPRTLAHNLEDTIKLKANLARLEQTELTPGQIFHCLHGYSQTALLTNLLAVDSDIVRHRMELYLNQLSHVQPALSGEDLLQAGLSSGPHIRQMLEMLQEARLDGKVKSGEEELELVKKWAEENPPWLSSALIDTPGSKEPF
jgi:tRNA nucleotidyltransferase (CCA-adding enzyme)